MLSANTVYTCITALMKEETNDVYSVHRQMVIMYLGIEIPLDIPPLTILDCDQICTQFLNTCE